LFDLVFKYQAKRLAGEDVSKMTNFVSGGRKTSTRSISQAIGWCCCQNAKQLPVLNAQEKAAKTAVLRTQFPVSSGSDHRSKESDWVPVTAADSGASSAPAATEEKVFHEPPSNVSYYY